MFRTWKSIVCRVLLATVAGGTLTLSSGCEEETAQKAALAMRGEPVFIKVVAPAGVSDKLAKLIIPR